MAAALPSLIAWDQDDSFPAAQEMRKLVHLRFKGERGRSRLLGAAVARFGGRCIQSHWSFTVFCSSRRWFGVHFELTVLLLTEIVSTVYYRLIRRHANDSALRTMCRLILRDENGHVAFHRERLAKAAWTDRRNMEIMAGLVFGPRLGSSHDVVGQPCTWFARIGSSTREFFREVWRELSRFIRRVRYESLREPKSIRPTSERRTPIRKCE